MSTWAYSETNQTVCGPAPSVSCVPVSAADDRKVRNLRMVNCRDDSLMVVHVLQNGSRATQPRVVSMQNVMQDAQLWQLRNLMTHVMFASLSENVVAKP